MPTAEERAKQFVSDWYDSPAMKKYDRYTDALADMIRAAEQEAYERGREDMRLKMQGMICASSHGDVRVEAYERAAKVVDDSYERCECGDWSKPEQVAAAIRKFKEATDA